MKEQKLAFRLGCSDGDISCSELTMQANANRDAPTLAITCDAASSPLQAGMPQPAGAAASSGGQTAAANAAEALVLYAMQRVAAKATRCMATPYTTCRVCPCSEPSVCAVPCASAKRPQREFHFDVVPA